MSLVRRLEDEDFEEYARITLDAFPRAHMSTWAKTEILCLVHPDTKMSISFSWGWSSSLRSVQE